MDDRHTTGETAAAVHPLLPLTVRDLSFAIGGKLLLDGVSFRLNDGGRTVILVSHFALPFVLRAISY